MDCPANASTTNDWIRSILPVAEVTSTLSAKLCSFPSSLSSNSHMGGKNLFISSLKPYVNFLGKLVENPFSPLGYGKALFHCCYLQLWNTWTKKCVLSICLYMRAFLLHFVSMCLQSSWEWMGFLCDWRGKGQQEWKTLFAFFFILL